MANPTVHTKAKRAAYMNTAIVMDPAFDPRKRELIAQQETDAIAKRIAEESRKLDPNQLVTRIDWNQIYATKIAHDNKKGLCYQIG